MKFLPNANPMARYEYKLAKENRKLAQIDLKKTEIDRMEDNSNLSEYLIVRVIARRIFLLFLSLFALIAIASINDVFQNHDIQQQITNCERALTQTHTDGDCSTGIIGTLPKEDK